MSAIAGIPAKGRYPCKTDGTHCRLKEAEDESSTFYDSNSPAIMALIVYVMKNLTGVLVNRPAKKLHSSGHNVAWWPKVRPLNKNKKRSSDISPAGCSSFYPKGTELLLENFSYLLSYFLFCLTVIELLCKLKRKSKIFNIKRNRHLLGPQKFSSILKKTLLDCIVIVNL